MRKEEGYKREYEYDVVVIGDVFYDIMTKPIKAYPKKDKQLGCEFIFSIGGQGGNCAAACASLGLKTTFIFKIGNDVFSKAILEELQKIDVHCFPVISYSYSEDEAHHEVGITVSIAFEDGSRSMLSDRGANMSLRRDNIDFEVIKKAKFLMRAGHWNTEGLFSANKEIMSFAKSAGIYTGVDIGWSAYLGWNEAAKKTVFDFLPFTDFLFANQEEIKKLSGMEREGEFKLLESGCKNIIIHKGKEGSAWVSKEKEVSYDAFKVKPVKPTGAGDVFNAAFIYAFLNLNVNGEEEKKECLKFANACAATHIKRCENVYPKVEEVKKLSI